MKIKALAIVVGLAVSTAAAGYAVVGDRYKVALDHQATKCYKAAQRVIAEDATSRLLSVNTVDHQKDKTVLMEFVINSSFGNVTKGHFQCEFKSPGRPSTMTRMTLNGYRYSSDQTVMINALSSL